MIRFIKYLWQKKWRIIGWSFLSFLVALLLIDYSVNKVISFSEPYVYEDVNKIEINKVGLVLGASKYLRNGGLNPYFKHRIEAASSLYFANKIEKIIVSGDNQNHSYNEPELMKKSLVKLGVNKNDIILDYAGLRTFDSMIRAKEVFGQSKITVISQKFHNERAVFIARKNGIETVGFNAKTPWMSKGMKRREYLAKFKAVLDVYILGTEPKFLGEKILVK